MELYDRIKARRTELNISQQELADKLGYRSRSSINKIEQGINDIPQSKIEEFAKALNTSPAWLMGWDNAPGKIDKSVLPNIPSPKEVDPDALAFKMYKSLDSDDKAEIRGEMKQMLKSDKYSKNEDTDISTQFGIAAYGGGIMQSAEDDIKTTL